MPDIGFQSSGTPPDDVPVEPQGRAAWLLRKVGDCGALLADAAERSDVEMIKQLMENLLKKGS